MTTVGVWPRLERRLAAAPQDTAVTDRAGDWSGGDLLAASARVAAALVAQGIGPGDRVAIHLENGASHLVGILACLRIGAVFTPIAFQYTTRREIGILARCGARAVICRPGAEQTVALMAETAAVAVDIDAPPNAPPAPDRPAGPDDPVYCVYTSGSTGTPKGVLIADRSLCHFIDATQRVFGLGPETVALCLSPFHFDGAFGSLFSVLTAGGRLVVAPGRRTTPTEFVALCRDHAVTHTSFAPSFLNLLAASPRLADLAATPLGTIGLGGEDCRRDDLIRLAQTCPGIRVFNRYGPTETTVVVASCELTPALLAETAELPIGQPAPGIRFYLAEDGRLVEGAGRPGELLIGGAQTMLGYLDAPDQTEAALDRRLVPGEALYRTGDLAYRDAEGRYVYLDRLDNVINRAGVRISLSEIARAALALDGVDDAAALSEETDLGTRIVAYIAGPGAEPATLRAGLAQALPPQMRPDRIVCVPDLPRAATGKLDMAALRARLANPETDDHPTA